MIDGATRHKRDNFLKSVAAGPVVMGILNVTPDSFSDGGVRQSTDAAISHALQMHKDGAAIVDIGAESTRPGATPVSEAEERSRLQPVLKTLCTQLPVAVSIDTYKAPVAAYAASCGVAVLNDIWGLQGDPDMATTVASTGCALIAMHNRKSTDTEINIMDDIAAFFERSLEIAKRAGIPDHHIILDPGIGFAKTVDQNYDILANLDDLKKIGYPILLGLSRKRMIGDVLNAKMNERLTGTLAANVLGLRHNADILRVHDVAEHIQAVKIFQKMEAAR